MRQRVGEAVNKFNAQRISVDGIWFDSKAEAREYNRLKQLEEEGKIADLILQPVFECVVNGKKICAYRADFSYQKGKKRIVADVKGRSTAEFKLKKKLVEALYGFEIALIPA